MRIQRPKATHAMYSLLSMNLLSCVWFNGNCFSGVKSFQGKLFSRKRKCIQAVWLSRKSFYGKSIPMFGSFKHFTENGSHFTENQFPCLVHSNILQKNKIHFTENHFPCLVCGSFSGKYEMPLQIQNLQIQNLYCLDKLVIVQK